MRWLICVALLATSAGCAPRELPYPHEGEPIASAREVWDGTLPPDRAVTTYRNAHRLFATRRVVAGTPRPLLAAERAVPPIRVPVGDEMLPLDSVLTLNRVAGLLVLHEGRVLIETYRFGNTPQTRWMSMSVAKSVLATLYGAALREGRLRSLDDLVVQHVPRLAGTAYEGVTLRHLLMMRSGVAWDETYVNPDSDRRRLLEAQIAQRPGAAMDVMATLERAAPPGTRTLYSTGETQVAAEALRQIIGMPLATYLSERIWKPAGMEADAIWWLDAPDGVEIGGSGLNARLRDYARFGQFVLEDGVVGGDTLLPPGWSREMGRVHSTLASAPDVPFGLLWWPAETPLGRSHGAFTAEGIMGQFLHIDPAARVVIVQWGARSRPQGEEVVDDRLVFDAIVHHLVASVVDLEQPQAAEARRDD